MPGPHTAWDLISSFMGLVWLPLVFILLLLKRPQLAPSQATMLLLGLALFTFGMTDIINAFEYRPTPSKEWLLSRQVKCVVIVSTVLYLTKRFREMKRYRSGEEFHKETDKAHSESLKKEALLKLADMEVEKQQETIESIKAVQVSVVFNPGNDANAKELDRISKGLDRWSKTFADFVDRAKDTPGDSNGTNDAGNGQGTGTVR